MLAALGVQLDCFRAEHGVFELQCTTVTEIDKNFHTAILP